MFKPNVNALVPAAMTPSSASANVDPITGWPANGISPPRPKMRSLMSVPGRSAGNTNVASEKLVSRVMAAIASVGESLGIEEDRELVAGERAVGEDVVLQEPAAIGDRGTSEGLSARRRGPGRDRESAGQTQPRAAREGRHAHGA